MLLGDNGNDEDELEDVDSKGGVSLLLPSLLDMLTNLFVVKLLKSELLFESLLPPPVDDDDEDEFEFEVEVIATTSIMNSLSGW